MIEAGAGRFYLPVMTLIIANPEAERLAHELAGRRGQAVDDAVTDALREALAKRPHQSEPADDLAERLMAIGRHCAALPTLDDRPDEEILGWPAGLQGD